MSKSALKKELQNLTKEQIIAQILDLYDKNKSVKEFYTFYLNPANEKELVEKYKRLIRKEFNVENPMSSRLKFSVAKKAISDFKNLQPLPESLADVMLYLPESACEFTFNYGDMEENFYNATYNNFKAVLKFMHKHDLLSQFHNRVQNCVKWTSNCGYGFTEDIADVYYEFYN